MYTSFDYINGFGPRLYRTPGEIKHDIAKVADRLVEINHMLNVRNIISEVITEQSSDDYIRKSEACRELCEFAQEVLLECRELNEALEELRDELAASIAIYRQ